MKKSIKVNAGQETVWNAIISYRDSQPHRRRIVKSEGQKYTVEESFTGLPMVGSSRVLYEEIEIPCVSIDFKLIEGEHLSKFQGGWLITPSADGQSCEATLTAEFDINLPIPFKENILNELAEMDMNKRLNYVKQTAEAPQPS